MTPTFPSDEILVWLLRHPAKRDRTTTAIAKGINRAETTVRNNLNVMNRHRNTPWVERTIGAPAVWALTDKGREVARSRMRRVEATDA